MQDLRYNIIFRARHIPGINNTRADCLSRFQIAPFKELSPRADELPTIEPEILMPKSSVLAPGSGHSYRRAWTLLREFYEKFHKTKSLPITVNQRVFVAFISFLDGRNLSPSTILSYLSAIGCVYKMKGLHDPKRLFFFTALLGAPLVIYKNFWPRSVVRNRVMSSYRYLNLSCMTS